MPHIAAIAALFMLVLSQARFTAARRPIPARA
jgi:hypothetical protein